MEAIFGDNVIDEVVRNLKTFEMKKFQNQKNAPPRKEVNLVLKDTQNQDVDEEDMLTWRFQRIIRREGL
uniref:Putative ovule protein n=1 Tax=Solanum chacoense TaxID=4108 RepID=A0A0V0HCL8_SOLCH